MKMMFVLRSMKVKHVLSRILLFKLPPGNDCLSVFAVFWCKVWCSSTYFGLQTDDNKNLLTL